MHTDSALGVQGGRCARAPTGFRRLTLSLLQATRAAVALSKGDIAARAFRSSIRGRRIPAPLTPCSLISLLAKALP